MNRKKLPKAVARTAAEMRQPDAPAPTPSNVIEIGVRPLAVEETAAQPQTQGDSERRRKAIAIIERYANLSTAGGALPIPLANAATVTALLMRMVQKLSELYDVPFERNRTRALIIGLMGGAVPTGLATIATSTLTVFIPGLNVMGLAVSAVTSGAYARSIGKLYLEHFEQGDKIDFKRFLGR